MAIDSYGTQLEPGDIVQVDDRASGYSGCVLDYLAIDGKRYICRNDSYPQIWIRDHQGIMRGAVRVRGVRFMRKGINHGA